MSKSIQEFDWLAKQSGKTVADIPDLLAAYATQCIREELEACIAICNEKITTARTLNGRCGPLELARNEMISRLAELEEQQHA